MTERAVDRLAAMLPPELIEMTGELPADLTELRLRPGKEIQLSCGQACRLTRGVAAPELIKKAADMLSKYSLYAWEEELKQGFFTLETGCRVGVCGKVAVDSGRITALTALGSMSIRVAKEVRGAANDVLPHLLEHGRPVSALVISRPGLGKTTMLRDIARQLSSLANVAICDERSEIAACVSGIPTMDVGPRTDVLDGCPKRVGMQLLIRSMSPEIIVTDELGHAGDAEALHEAARCGVTVIASAHASGYADAADRTALGTVLRDGLFDRIVVLAGEIGRVAEVLDSSGRPVAAP